MPKMLPRLAGYYVLEQSISLQVNLNTDTFCKLLVYRVSMTCMRKTILMSCHIKIDLKSPYSTHEEI